MKKGTKISLVNLGGELLYVIIGIVTAVGITNMTKDINKGIQQRDDARKNLEKKSHTKRFWQKR